MTRNFTAEEMEYLLIHGLLHLLGHDHAEPDEKSVMFGLNDRIIADWRSESGAAPDVEADTDVS